VLENLRFRFGFVSGFSFRLAKQTQTQKPTRLENELEPGSKVCKTAREILSVYLGTPIPIPSRFLRAAESLLWFLFRFGPTLVAFGFGAPSSGRPATSCADYPANQTDKLIKHRRIEALRFQFTINGMKRRSR